MPSQLLDQVRGTLRRRHYSLRTETTYLHWIRRYIVFHHKRHPAVLGTADLESFLTSLAVNDHVSAATQNQALSALLFLYRHVLHIDLELPTASIRPCAPAACLPSSAATRSMPSSPASPAPTSSWPRCSTAPACG